jgi:selenocysteine lyase/cysteine desulfurase
MAGGTGSESESDEMPAFLPDRLEAGTLNVPGIAGLDAGLRYLQETGIEKIFHRERKLAKICANALQTLGYQVFSGAHQGGTVSFVTADCEKTAQHLADRGIAVRAGLHCAPLAHESARTLQTGTVRVSFGYDSDLHQVQKLCGCLRQQ